MRAVLVVAFAIAVAFHTGSALANKCQDANGQCDYLATPACNQLCSSYPISTNLGQLANCCLDHKAREGFSEGAPVLPRGGGMGWEGGGNGRRGEGKAAHERRVRGRDEKVQRRRGISQRALGSSPPGSPPPGSSPPGSPPPGSSHPPPPPLGPVSHHEHLSLTDNLASMALTHGEHAVNPPLPPSPGSASHTSLGASSSSHEGPLLPPTDHNDQYIHYKYMRHTGVWQDVYVNDLHVVKTYTDSEGNLLEKHIYFANDGEHHTDRPKIDRVFFTDKSVAEVLTWGEPNPRRITRAFYNQGYMASSDTSGDNTIKMGLRPNNIPIPRPFIPGAIFKNSNGPITASIMSGVAPDLPRRWKERERRGGQKR